MKKAVLRSLTALAVCSSFVWASSAAAAEDWPTFRGNNRRSGVTAEAADLPLSLQWTFKPIHPPRPAWPMPAEELPRMHADSAPHVVSANGVAYFGSPVDNRLYAIDVAAGKVRWTFTAEGPVRFAPSLDKGRVYFGSDDGRVYCLDAATGKLAWKYRPGPNDSKVIGNGRMISTWPVRTSVLVDGGHVFATAGVFPFEGIYICCLDAADGSVVWQNDALSGRSHELTFGGISPHGYLVASKNILYVPSGRAMPAAFDRKTGRLHFYAQTAGKRGGTWALLDDDRLIAGVDASGAPDKRAYDAKTGEHKGDAFTWAPRGIDMAVSRDISHVVTRIGIQTINRKALRDSRRIAKDATAKHKGVSSRLAAMIKDRGCPPEIPMPNVHLSDLEAVKATCGWGKPMADRSVTNRPLSIGGKQYAKGMGVHSFSELVYPLKPGYKAFVAAVGIDDVAKHRGSPAFQVFIDGKLVRETPTMLGSDGHWNIHTPIPPGSKMIRLVATKGSDGLYNWDHANWVNAGFVTGAVKPIPPHAEWRPKLAAKINALRKERDAVARVLQQAMSVRDVRTHAEKNLNCIIRAGNVLFAGGKGLVIAVDARTNKRLWTANVGGRAVGLAAADGRLFVSTDAGLIYCFGPNAPPKPAVITPTIHPKRPDTIPSAAPYQAAAEKIVKETGITKGFCVVRDCGAGRLAVELAKRTELKIIGLEKDPAKLAAARQNAEAAGLLGTRIVVEPWDPAGLPDYFANLIVSGEKLFSRRPADFGKDWTRLLRPGGGTIALCARQGDEIVIDKIVRAKLKGAGSWTSLYGNAQNTACSEDQLVRGPLGLLWYGDPGPQGMVERHARAAGPVSINGRLFVQGEDVIRAYDAYNGAVLWQRDIPGAVRIRVDVDGGNLALTENALYVAAADKCHRLDPATGKIVRSYTMPRATDGSPRRWGYIAAAGNVLLGTTVQPLRRQYGHVWKSLAFSARQPAPDVDTRREFQRRGRFWRGLARFPSWGSQGTPNGALTDRLVAGDALFALNADTGQVLWCYRGKEIPSISVAAANGVIYFVEKASTPEHRAAALEQKQKLITKGIREPARAKVDPRNADVRLVVAASLATGEILWRKPVDLTGCGGDKLGAAVKDGVLLLFGHFSNHDTGLFLGNHITWRRITALDARSGDVIWSRPLNYLRRPLIVGDTVIIEPRACDLKTGKTRMRRHPITGQSVPWEFLRPGHCCSITAASAGALFYRSGSSAIYDLAGDAGLNVFGGIRPGCWLNMISAGGVMLMPEASSGCTCSYPLRASLALVHKPRRLVDDATVFITHGPQTPVKRLGVNLGATGDVRDEDGKLWFAYPRPRAVSGVGYGEYGLKFALNEKVAAGMGPFAREFRRSRIAGTNRPWLFSSGCTGLLRCELPLIDDLLGETPGRYTLRLGFAAPNGDRPGQRVFDVKVQGKIVVEGLDIVKEAGAPNKAVVKQVAGITVKNVLVLELVPRKGGPAKAEAPVINFIEAVREDAIPAPPKPPAAIAADLAKQLLAKADAELKNGKAEKALDLCHRVFDAAGSADEKLQALQRIIAHANPESLGRIRKSWDQALAPILAGYRPTDPRVFDGMVRLRLAVADKLAVRGRRGAPRIILATERARHRIADAGLKLRLIEKLGYVVRWRVLGPIPWGPDQAAVADVIKTARPIAPPAPRKVGDRTLKWVDHAAAADYVDLAGVLGTGHYASGYAYAEIKLDEPRDLLLNVQADDAGKCWFNGTPAGTPKEWAGGRGALKVRGRKGVNTFLIQVVNSTGGWTVRVRVTDTDGRPCMR